MAVPRVFISSTYYDLRQVRNNVGNFIKELGYEPVMHERSGVAYTQTGPLEADCYHELASCDIVVCIIGNHFGSQSSNNKLSITMNELDTAIKNKKKVYIFIAHDVYIENRTYEQNRENGEFKSAYTDDIKIHEYIYELKNNTKVHLIEPFETTDQIVATLKAQFAGLFQNLLSREASLTESKTAYDLQQSSDEMKTVIEEFKKEKEAFFAKFDGTIFANKTPVSLIKRHLGISNIALFVNDLVGLDELMELLNFKQAELENVLEDTRNYIRVRGILQEQLILKDELFDDDMKIKDIRNKLLLNGYIIWNTREIEQEIIFSDDDLPF